MSSPLYYTVRAIINGISSVLWRARASGTANVPRTGPLIVACNHVSYLDPPVMGSLCPRKVSYMAKASLFNIPALGPLIRGLGAYPVERDGNPTAAIKRSVEVLRSGGCVGIFPEGTRNVAGNVEARQGVAFLASLGWAPVVPAAIVGSERAGRLGKIKVAFGPPLRLPAGRKATRDELAKFTDEVMSAIDALKRQLEFGDSGGNS